MVRLTECHLNDDSRRDNELTNWAGAPFSYDANGNLTADGANKYVWDARNHLSSMTTSTGSPLGSFTYDPFGRRTGKTITGTTTGFLYDGVNAVQELSASNAPTANLLTGLGVDEVFTRTDSATSTFLTDALGSTLALANSSGSVQTNYSYEPFGRATVTGTASSNSFQYAGRENDGTGIYYYRARYYSPQLQRFVSEDPLEFLSRDFNLYGYVGNNPTASIDPMGLQPVQGWSTLSGTAGPLTVSLTRDDYGNWYISPQLGYSAPTYAATLMRGSLDDNPYAYGGEGDISQHLTSWSFAGCVGYLLGGCKTYTPNARPWNRWGSSLGLSTPEISLGIQYGWKVSWPSWLKRQRLAGRKQD